MKKFLVNSLFLLGLIATPVLNADVISEFQPNAIGGDPDPQSIELLGTANAAFDLWVISIESDGSSATGLVDRAANVTGTYDSFGIATVTMPDLENPSFTVILASDFTGTIGATDIDTDDDGVVDDITAFTGIMDALGVPDDDGTGGSTLVYGSQLGGADFTYTGDEPKLVFRDGVTGAWYAANDPDNGMIFDINAVDVLQSGSFSADPFNPTFGTVNPTFIAAVPEPGSLAVIGLGMLGMFATRRRRS